MLCLTATLKLLGRRKEGENAFATVMEMNPTFTHAKHFQQTGKHAIGRMERTGGIRALKEHGLPDE
jgi:hypothetical protein